MTPSWSVSRSHSAKSRASARSWFLQKRQ